MDNILKGLKTLPRNIPYWSIRLLMEEGNNSYLKRVDITYDYQRLQNEIAHMYKNYKKNETE